MRVGSKSRNERGINCSRGAASAVASAAAAREREHSASNNNAAVTPLGNCSTSLELLRRLYGLSVYLRALRQLTRRIVISIERASLTLLAFAAAIYLLYYANGNSHTDFHVWNIDDIFHCIIRIGRSNNVDLCQLRHSTLNYRTVRSFIHT